MMQRVILVIFLSIIAGCATTPKPLVGIVPGKVMETVQSSVSISTKTHEGSRGGRGYLIFRRPDRFHLAMLSPFGITMLEVFSDNERLVCLIPSKNTAYTGLISELPAMEGVRGWGLMRWVVEIPPASGPAIKRENITSAGRREMIYYDGQGVVSRKVTEDGDQVSFKEYQVYDGIAFPNVIELTTAYGEEIRITFDEPELNRPVEDSALLPNLEGFSILPFTAFQGF
jgi:hypothetical protein